MDWGNLVGVLIGGLITGAASLGLLRRQVDADRQTRRQERLTDLIVDFVEAADEDWRTAEEQHLARVHRDGAQQNWEAVNEFERAVDESTRRMMTSNQVTRRQLAKLRILEPALFETASDLIYRSGPIADHDEAERLRNEAMWAFEAAARKALDVVTPPGTQVRIVSRGGGK